MSIGGDFMVMRDKIEKVRSEQGDAAAAQYEKELHASYIGGTAGMAGGAIGGAAIGSMILPGVGTAIGGILGGFVGLVSGVKDKSLSDNVKTYGKAAGSVFRSLK